MFSSFRKFELSQCSWRHLILETSIFQPALDPPAAENITGIWNSRRAFPPVHQVSGRGTSLDKFPNDGSSVDTVSPLPRIPLSYFIPSSFLFNYRHELSAKLAPSTPDLSAYDRITSSVYFASFISIPSFQLPYRRPGVPPRSRIKCRNHFYCLAEVRRAASRRF